MLNPLDHRMDDGTICYYNIGPRERRKRLRGGMLALAAGVMMAVALLALDADRLWRFVLAVPFSGAASGYLQAHYKT